MQGELRSDQLIKQILQKYKTKKLPKTELKRGLFKKAFLPTHNYNFTLKYSHTIRSYKSSSYSKGFLDTILQRRYIWFYCI